MYLFSYSIVQNYFSYPWLRLTGLSILASIQMSPLRAYNPSLSPLPRCLSVSPRHRTSLGFASRDLVHCLVYLIILRSWGQVERVSSRQLALKTGETRQVGRGASGDRKGEEEESGWGRRGMGKERGWGDNGRGGQIIGRGEDKKRLWKDVMRMGKEYLVKWIGDWKLGGDEM